MESSIVAQHLVSPLEIESKLSEIWDSLEKTSTIRASLFNLIVFSRLSQRTDYFRNIIGNLVEKFPCRVLFITGDPDPNKEYLKTAVSVLAPKQERPFGCDLIDIGMAGKDYLRVPFIILPHLLTDLPVYLLWAEDPSLENPLFESLSKMVHRVIFDSESADALSPYIQTILSMKKTKDVADLNWARTEGWRDLLAAQFYSQENLDSLENVEKLEISYNSYETTFFCHPKVQALYIQSWLAAQLEWTIEKKEKEKTIYKTKKGKVESLLTAISRSNTKPATLLSMKLTTKDGQTFLFERDEKIPHQIHIDRSTPTLCQLPQQFIMSPTTLGQSLAKEIINKGTSDHYLAMLNSLSQLERL